MAFWGTLVTSRHPALLVIWLCPPQPSCESAGLFTEPRTVVPGARRLGKCKQVHGQGQTLAFPSGAPPPRAVGRLVN